MNTTDFKGSAGWLTKWKLQNNVEYKINQGESGAVDRTLTEDWLNTVWKTVLSKYKDCDIYNCDETGLLFKILPNRTFEFKGKNCSGGKHSKDRLTVLLCCNKDGSDKIKPLVIGKYANPRCLVKFRNRSALPVNYEANSKAWMVGSLSKDWTETLDKEMRAKNRKILLVMDNCSSQPKNMKLTKYEILFLPPNSTSVLQPLDQGIINDVKRIYRRLLIRKMIRCMDWEIPVKINVLDCIIMLHSAWRQLPPSTIRNCFKHGLGHSGDPRDESDVESFPVEYTRLGINGANHLVEYETIDANVETEGMETDDDIIARAVGGGTESEVLVSEPEDETSEEPVISIKEAILSLEKLKLWMIAQGGDCSKQLNELIAMETIAANKYQNSLRQTTVRDFFPNND